MKTNDKTIGTIKVNVETKIEVSRRDAEACLKLVEFYLNNNCRTRIETKRLYTGEIKLEFVSSEEKMKDTEVIKNEEY